MSDAEPRELLVLAVDLNPVWWGLQESLGIRQLLQCALTFANSHLLVCPGNEICFLGVCGEFVEFLYPVAQPDASPAPAAVLAGADGAKFELFSGMNDCVKDGAESLVRSSRPDRLRSGVCMAGAIVKALCFISRRQREISPGDQLAARILLLKGCDDEASQYMSLMNAVFAAQKRQIRIDACVIERESTLLRQASELSGGLYLCVPRPAALLQYLLSVFLASPSVRESSLVLPAAGGASDSRPACFCHRRLVSTAFVCSLCLSVFCKYTPLCNTCNTTFPPPPLQPGAGVGKRRQARAKAAAAANHA